jgi:iron complex transport system permease protein
MKWMAGLALVLLAASVLSVANGAVTISPSDIWHIVLRHGDVDPQKAAVLLSIRLPRVVLAILVGAGLGISGAAMQGLFRNPLADPSLIGISSGAALAATLVFVVGDAMSRHWISFLPAAAFAGALLTTILVHRLAQSGGQTVIATMLLSGIAINAIAQAGSSFLTFIATDSQIRGITFWRLGSLGGATWSSILLIAPFILVPVVALPFFSAALNAFLLGESEAFHLGINVSLIKNLVILLVAMAAGASVAVTGIIGFVGLVVPHLIRLASGPDYRRLLPASALLGATLVLISDLISRTVVVPAELPIGIITALAGGPFFLWLLMRDRSLA